MTFLELLRRAHGLHQWQLAEKIKLTPTIVSQLETGYLVKLRPGGEEAVVAFFGEFWTLDRLIQNVSIEKLMEFLERTHDRIRDKSGATNG